MKENDFFYNDFLHEIYFSFLDVDMLECVLISYSLCTLK